MKVIQAAFLFLNLRFILFGKMKIGRKSAFKMLVNLMPRRSKGLSVDFVVLQKCRILELCFLFYDFYRRTCKSKSITNV